MQGVCHLTVHHVKYVHALCWGMIPRPDDTDNPRRTRSNRLLRVPVISLPEEISMELETSCAHGTGFFFNLLFFYIGGRDGRGRAWRLRLQIMTVNAHASSAAVTTADSAYRSHRRHDEKYSSGLPVTGDVLHFPACTRRRSHVRPPGRRRVRGHHLRRRCFTATVLFTSAVTETSRKNNDCCTSRTLAAGQEWPGA